MERAGQLHHLEFYVNDLAQSRKFWGHLLREYGWQEFQGWDEGISWKKDDGVPHSYNGTCLCQVP